MCAVLGGIDALVFTAGVGENSADVRAAVCSNLGWLGIEIDATANAGLSPDGDAATPDSRVRILVIRAQEDWAIATECWNLMSARLRLSQNQRLWMATTYWLKGKLSRRSN